MTNTITIARRLPHKLKGASQVYWNMDHADFNEKDIGTIAPLSTNEFEWNVPDFLSMVNIAVDQCKDAWLFSPNFEACESEWYMGIEIGSNGDISVLLSFCDLVIDERRFACFLGLKKSDGTVEEWFLSTTLTFRFDNRVVLISFAFNELLTRKSSLLPSGALTITCSIHLPVPETDFNYNVVQGSVTELDNGNFEWKIPNCLEQQTHLSHFYVRRKGINLKLEIAYGSVLVYLRIKYFWAPFLCSVGLRKSNGMVEQRCPSMPEKFTDNSFKLLFRLPIRELHRRKLELLPSDTLTVVFSVQVVNYTPARCGPLKECTIKSEKHTGLANERLKQLFLSEEDKDVVLNVQGKEFKAHRCILKVGSLVLAATFQHDMVEKLEGVVKIDDCDPDSFGNFLHFLYTGRTMEYPDFDHALQLYKTAHKYDVPDLREECLEYLKGNLTIENVCNVMSLALQYDEDQLHVFAKEFCLENSTAVAETPQFGKFFCSNVTQAQKLVVEMTKAKK